MNLRPTAGDRPQALRRDDEGSGRILVIDDEPAIARLVSSVLRRAGFSVQTCTDPLRLESIADPAPPDLVITDLGMPGRDGVEVLRLVTQRYPETGAIVVTGADEVTTAVQAMQLGALDYIVKPFENRKLKECVAKALSKQREAIAQKRTIEHLQATVAAQQMTICDLQDVLGRASDATLLALTRALDAREKATAGHSERVSRYSVALAEFACIDGDELERLRTGSLLHDVGKIGIPDDILLKPGKLENSEWSIMRQHPEIGYRILEPCDNFRNSAGLVLAHHERWDGAGYPHKLSGHDIPVGARIFAIADAFDAMTSDRPYRSRMAVEDAVREIGRCSGSQFDPELASIFLANAANILTGTNPALTIV